MIAKGSIAHTEMSVISPATSACAKSAIAVSVTVMQAIHVVPCIRERVEIDTKCPSIMSVFTEAAYTVYAGIYAGIKMVT